MKRTFIIASVVCVVVVGMIGVLPLLAQTPTPPPSRLDHDRGLIDLPRYPQAAAPMSSDHTPLAPNDMAAWSKLTYQSYIGNWDIFAANGDGSNPVRLTSSGAPDITPRFNRGATRVAYASSEPGNYEIFAMNANGSNRVRLTNQAANDYNPAWSPDGTKIVFNSYRDGQSEIYVMNADGSNPVRLTNAAGYDGQPAWSPDGTKIAFVSDRAGGSRIWVMNANGSGATQLTTVPYSEDPAWSPDGTKIAFDADSEGDGWQELMVVNTDGTNVHVIGDMGNAADMWARSWSPDGRSVAFTAIYYIYYQGNWYWTAAYSFAADTVAGGAYSLGGSDTDWFPDWQTTDVLPPTSSMMALPATSPAPIAVKWSGVDAGPAGILGYDVQVKDGAGAWTMWLTRTAQTSASYPGVGGHTYSFRVRALDNSNNAQAWPASAQASTTVEALPPISAISPLPMYYRGELPVSWSSSDPGGSSIQSYDVQYRDGITGTWTNWLSGTSLTTAAFTGEAGHAYSFRVRAIDRAQNQENWSSGPFSSTTFYVWQITGLVSDGRNRRVVDAAIELSPPSLTPITSTASGYQGYLSVSGVNTLTVSQPSWGSTPPMSVTIDRDMKIDHWLAPLDDIIQDGGFENATITTSWVLAGEPIPVITFGAPHTGRAAMSLGNAFRFVPLLDGWENLEFDAQLDKQGTLHIISTQVSADGLGQQLVYAQKSLTATTFPSPTVILTLQPGWQYIRRPSVLLDSQGGLHIIGIHADPTTMDAVFYCYKEVASQTCTNPIDLGPYWPDQSTYNGPQIAEDSLGGLHAVWANYSVQYAYRSPSGVWSAPESLSGQLANAPDVAVDKNNVVHVIWAERHSATMVAFYRSKPLNSNWTVVSAMGIPGDFCRSQIETSANGAVHALWHIAFGQVAYTRYLGINNWQAPDYFPASANGCSAGELTFDQGSQPLVITSYNSTIYYNYPDRTGIWRSLAGASSHLPQGLFAQTDSMGDVHVLWGEYGSAFHYLKTGRATNTADFSVSQPLILPPGLQRATVSVSYQTPDQIESGNQVHISVNDGSNSTEIASVMPSGNDWEQVWADVSLWTGQSVTLTVEWQQAAGKLMSRGYFDEIFLGSWLTPDPQTITPNRIEANASTVITITGDNFIDPPQVRLNDVPALDTHWVNTNTITATVSALPNGRYDVIVINPGGQASGVPYGLTVGRLAFLPMLLK